MTITVKLLRAAGVPPDLIAKVCELEEQGRLDVEDEKRARHRAAQAKYRNNLKKGDSGDDHVNHVISPDRYIEPSVSTNLSEGQGSFLSLDDSLLTTPRARARSKAHANGNGHDHFEDFWIAFPEKRAKAAARKAFARALKRATVQQIAEGLQRYRDTKPEDVSWCYPATWLNQDRWLDEPAPPVPKRKSPQKEYREELDEIFDRMQQEARDRHAK